MHLLRSEKFRCFLNVYTYLSLKLTLYNDEILINVVQCDKLGCIYVRMPSSAKRIPSSLNRVHASYPELCV